MHAAAVQDSEDHNAAAAYDVGIGVTRQWQEGNADGTSRHEYGGRCQADGLEIPGRRQIAGEVLLIEECTDATVSNALSDCREQGSQRRERSDPVAVDACLRTA